jgi:hypothetical protein
MRLAMDTQRLLEIGAQGIHLLFDHTTILEAFQQDADRLRKELDGRLEEVHFAIDQLVQLEDAEEGRRFIAELSPSVRYVLVLLYFELIDGRLRHSPTLH